MNRDDDPVPGTNTGLLKDCSNSEKRELCQEKGFSRRCFIKPGIIQTLLQYPSNAAHCTYRYERVQRAVRATKRNMAGLASWIDTFGSFGRISRLLYAAGSNRDIAAGRQQPCRRNYQRMGLFHVTQCHATRGFHSKWRLDLGYAATR